MCCYRDAEQTANKHHPLALFWKPQVILHPGTAMDKSSGGGDTQLSKTLSGHRRRLKKATKKRPGFLLFFFFFTDWLEVFSSWRKSFCE